MRRWIWFILTLVLIFTSNAFFVRPRELSSDSAWLLQELTQIKEPPDVKRQGPLLVTPTRVAVGESVFVTVEANSGPGLRALVMIDREGQWLDTRYDPLRTQEFRIPLDGLTGDYRFWLSGEAQTPQSGLGVITVEVYDPVPGNLRRAAPLEVVQKFVEATQSEDLSLATACVTQEQAENAALQAEIQTAPSVAWVRGELLYEEPARPDGQVLRCLVRIDLQVRYEDGATRSEFWGERNVSRYVVLHRTEEGWRIAFWSSQWPQEFAALRPPTRTQAPQVQPVQPAVPQVPAEQPSLPAGAESEPENLPESESGEPSSQQDLPAMTGEGALSSGEEADAPQDVTGAPQEDSLTAPDDEESISVVPEETAPPDETPPITP